MNSTNIMVIDVGGSRVKALLSGEETPVRADSGPLMTAAQMVEAVKAMTSHWHYGGVTIGYPGVVKHNQITHDPVNLGPNWIGYDFEAVFGCPVKVINDAAMQALGDYEGGRMLFLGLGTGLGTAMIIDGIVAPMELGHLPYQRGRTFEQYVGSAGLEREGKKQWRVYVADVIARLFNALEPDYVLLGGGNTKYLKDIPPYARIGPNSNAFKGGFRLWETFFQG
jgi:polyphosphate glucokinase